MHLCLPKRGIHNSIIWATHLPLSLAPGCLTQDTTFHLQHTSGNTPLSETQDVLCGCAALGVLSPDNAHSLPFLWQCFSSLELKVEQEADLQSPTVVQEAISQPLTGFVGDWREALLMWRGGRASVGTGSLCPTAAPLDLKRNSRRKQLCVRSIGALHSPRAHGIHL